MPKNISVVIPCQDCVTPCNINYDCYISINFLVYTQAIYIIYVRLLIKVVFVAMVQQFADLHACTYLLLPIASYPGYTASLVPRPSRVQGGSGRETMHHY